MRNRIIIGVSALILGILFYFTRSWWMELVVPSQEVLVETGVVDTGTLTAVTGTQNTGTLEMPGVWLGDIDGSVILHGEYPKYADWQKKYSFGCSFYELMSSINNRTLVHGSGIITCSNGLKLNFEIITQNGNIVVHDTNQRYLGTFNYWTNDPNGDDSDYAFFGNGEYLIDQKGGGDVYESWSSTRYVHINNGNKFEIKDSNDGRSNRKLIELKNEDITLSFSYLQEKIDNGDIPQPIVDVLGSDASVVKFLGYTIKDNTDGEDKTSNILLRESTILYPGPCDVCTFFSGLNYILDIPNNKLTVTFENANTKSAIVDLRTFEMILE